MHLLYAALVVKDMRIFCFWKQVMCSPVRRRGAQVPEDVVWTSLVVLRTVRTPAHLNGPVTRAWWKTQAIFLFLKRSIAIRKLPKVPNIGREGHAR